jgi:hypothetical protein
MRRYLVCYLALCVVCATVPGKTGSDIPKFTIASYAGSGPSNIKAAPMSTENLGKIHGRSSCPGSTPSGNCPDNCNECRCKWFCTNSDLPCSVADCTPAIPGHPDTCKSPTPDSECDYTQGTRCDNPGDSSLPACKTNGTLPFRCWQQYECKCVQSANGWTCMKDAEHPTSHLDLNRCKSASAP